MTTGTLTLTEFLLARIAEDEAGMQVDAGPLLPPFAWLKRRVLAECEAKRLLVTYGLRWPQQLPSVGSPDFDKGAKLGAEEAFDMTIRLLAAVYADHPDYRDEWRP